MREKLKSIKNKAVALLKDERVANAAQKTRKFSQIVYQKIYNSVTFCAKWLHQNGVSANFVTICGFVIGLLALNFLAMEMYMTALLCILLNRWFDAIDGAIAKMSQVTKFGVFLDAALDYVFYGAVIFGFALANPAQNAVAAAFLLFAFSAAACSLLAYAVIAYKDKKAFSLEIDSPFYLGGVAQGFETFIALVVLCLFPGWFLPVALILGVLSLVKALTVITTAYYSFVIAEKAPKE